MVRLMDVPAEVIATTIGITFVTVVFAMFFMGMWKDPSEYKEKDNKKFRV